MGEIRTSKLNKPGVCGIYYYINEYKSQGVQKIISPLADHVEEDDDDDEEDGMLLSDSEDEYWIRSVLSVMRQMSTRSLCMEPLPDLGTFFEPPVIL